jgi:hypothetical protein
VASTYASHENGQTPVPQDAAAVYAKAFKTSVAWLLTGENPGNDIVQVDGAVLKHGSVDLFRIKDSPWVQLPFGIIPGTIVLQVRDGGMAPRYEVGDIVLVDENNPDVGAFSISEVVDEEVLVTTEPGDVFLKRLRRAKRQGLYDLEGTNSPTLKNVVVVRAHLVIATIKAQQVSDLYPGKARAEKRARK